MKVNVIGLGYIGLPTALTLAANDVEVIGTDYNEKVIKTLQTRELTFEEKGLETVFKKALDKGIKFSTSYHIADVYIVAVPTPYIKENKKIDPQYVVCAFESVLDVAPNGSIVIIESTISPGTIDQFIRPIVTARGLETGKDIHIVHAPERILPGNMLYEFENNNRIIGADSPEIAQVVKEIYAKVCKAEIITTDIRTAEMTKVIENTFRDINIAFANELAIICHYSHLDVYEIIKLANKHPRVNILQPGPGVGGHCISVDPWFLVGDFPEIVDVIRSARRVNDKMPTYILKRIREVMKEHHLHDVSEVGLYGLTYKENVDDTRESPTLQLLEKMDENLAFGIKVYDPFIKTNIVDGQIQDFDQFLEGIKLLVILVAHDHIKENIEKIKAKIIFDTRNVVVDGDKVYKL